MLPLTENPTPTVAATGHPADNATETTLTQAAAGAIEANAYESLVVDLLLVDPVSGAKSAVITLWEKDTADGTVGDGTWTALVPGDPSLEGDLTPDYGTGARSAIGRVKIPMRLVSKKFVAAKAVVTHADPSASLATFMALIVAGENKRRS